LIVLLVVAAVVVGAPIGAAVLVTLASHYEDGARTLARRPPGPFAAAARRLVCLRIGGSAYPRRPARRISAMPEPEDGGSASGRTPPLTLSRR